mmetsp:Transcript_7869/g.20142  ORF Transcript_7869/g.20142 Transcript_7869/m.20142 type:complete len:440 (+) Transcript_7869:222-1541(+)|eukprot:CAMPEP_0198236736 /NCGR_PEP_ID=MMETSP1446-20131203/2631_1 /TAXON_ID=1461542 ORGANISM="Unidentified sp, Strain CCMP2111" /NCGR_SAMPLE_ID=MMETSP1446 /ASSEMBLY_ACC=CAM_ASM_001112 /LENGTH=439 /DNA_ID=CAMNT_0043918649 /DNA_START=173 /DNA_END=1492 /DNA_ORIENTATION=-
MGQGALDVSPPGRSALAFPRMVVMACFLATFSFYVERTGFPVVFTQVAQEKNISETLKGTIFSAFYYGYATSQIPASWIAFRVGGYKTLMLAFIGWSFFSIITPFAMHSVPLLLFARGAVGVSQGFVIPSVHSILAATMGPGDKSKAVSFVTSGMYLGSSTAFMVVPWLVKSFGTDISVELLGLLGIFWLLLWLSMGHHVSECQYKASLSLKSGHMPGPNKDSIPWLKILSHKAVWAILWNNFAFHYSLYVIMNWLPTYFENVVRSKLTNLGWAKVMPYICMFLAANVAGVLGERMVLKMNVDTKTTRAIINATGLGLAAMTLHFLMPCANTKNMGVFATTLTLALLGFSRGGWAVNHMDIAPEYAGVIMAISNTAGTVAGIIGVSFTGYLLENAGGARMIAGWQRAFTLAAAVNVCAILIFSCYSQGQKVFTTARVAH